MGLIVTLLLAAVAIYLVFWILAALPLPEPIKKVAELVLGVLVLLWLLGLLTGQSLVGL